MEWIMTGVRVRCGSVKTAGAETTLLNGSIPRKHSVRASLYGVLAADVYPVGVFVLGGQDELHGTVEVAEGGLDLLLCLLVETLDLGELDRG